MLQWGEWGPSTAQQPTAPSSLQLVDYFPVNTDALATESRQPVAVHVLFLEAMGVAVSAHRKANDDHIRVTGENECPHMPFAYQDRCVNNRCCAHPLECWYFNLKRAGVPQRWEGQRDCPSWLK